MKYRVISTVGSAYSWSWYFSPPQFIVDYLIIFLLYWADMLTTMTSKVILSLWRIKQRLSKSPATVDISQQLAAVKNVLVNMPHVPDQVRPALIYLQRLIDAFPEWQITIVGPQKAGIKQRRRTHLFLYAEENFGLLGLPRASFVKKLKRQPFDLFLDFSFNGKLINIYWLRLSAAPLRVCFASDEKSPFCNFEIRVNSLESVESKYEAMVTYIIMWAKSGHSMLQAEGADL